MKDQRINFVCIPYLPLGRAYDIAQWVLVPASQYSGSWLDDTYKKRAAQLLKRFTWVNGSPAKDIPIVVHAEKGANGTVPTDDEGRALQLAIDIACIDQALTLPGEAIQRLVTTDNTEMQIWPLSADGFIAFPTGLRVKTNHGGWNLERDDWGVPCPLDVYMPVVNVSCDRKLATAIYEVVLQGVTDPAKVTERRLAIALGWWAKAWRNSPSVSWEDRVVLLKTGYEALLDTSSTPEATKRLRNLFEKGGATAGEKIKGLLWSSGETANRPHPFAAQRSKGIRVTDLEHWFLSFGDARNNIIHSGGTPTLVYNEKDSPYNGSFIDVGERVMREAVKMQLELIGHHGLWMSGLDRAIHDAVEEFDAIT